MSDFVLWPHQAEGAAWAVDTLGKHGGAALWWGLRSGKTRTALATAAEVGRSTLVVSPQRDVMRVWEREALAMRWDGEVAVLDRGSVAKRAEALRSRPSLVIVNYEAMWREPLASALRKHGFDLVVYDEGHKLKSPSGRASRYAGLLAQSVPHRVALSGTPLAHDAMDAWATYRAIDRDFTATGFPRTFTQFRARYTRPALRSEWRDPDVLVTTGRGQELLRWKLHNMDDLNERMYRIANRREAPPPDIEPTESTWYVDLEPEAARVYREVQRDLISQHEGDLITAANALVRDLRLAQIAGGSVKDEDGNLQRVSTAKQEALTEYLSEVGDEPVVVFARFHSDLDTVHAAAKATGISSGELSGRGTQLDEWKAGEFQVLAVQEQAGGVGLDMTRARLCVYLSMSYSLTDYLQSRARVLGPMQARGVDYTFIVARGTVDEAVRSALNARRSVIDAVLDQLR